MDLLEQVTGDYLDAIAEFFYGIKRDSTVTDDELRASCRQAVAAVSRKPSPVGASGDPVCSAGQPPAAKSRPIPYPTIHGVTKPAPYAGRECPCGKLPPRDGMPGCEYHHV